jgi:hypothetical protein
MRKKQDLRIVEWRNASCVLRFKTSQPLGEELDFRFLLRFREPITRSRRTVRGKVPDYRNGDKEYGGTGMQHGESFNETKALWVLVASAHADVLKVQPFQLVFVYEDDGKLDHYTPDILIVWGDEMWAIDVKDDRERKLLKKLSPKEEQKRKAKREREKKRFAKIGELLATHRIHFLLWSRSAICEEPRFRIAQDVLEYQSCQVSPLDRERIRQIFAEHKTLRLRNFNDEDICRVLSLVVSGMLHIDWWQHQLSGDTLVSVSPFGRQEWPNDRSAAAQQRARRKLFQ